MDKNEYKKLVEEGQDIFDLCLQEYGGLNALFLLLADNPALDLIQKLTPGEQINLRVEVPANVPINKGIMDYFRKNDIRVNMQEKELLADDVLLVTAAGNSLSTASGVMIATSNTSAATSQPVMLTGLLTSSGHALVASNGAIITAQTAPTIAGSNGFSILTAQGSEIQINPPQSTYITTASGSYIKTAQGNLLIKS